MKDIGHRAPDTRHQTPDTRYQTPSGARGQQDTWLVLGCTRGMTLLLLIMHNLRVTGCNARRFFAFRVDKNMPNQPYTSTS